MTQQLKISTVGCVPATPGTRIELFSVDYLNADADADESIIWRHQHPIVAWEIRRNNFDLAWADPVCVDIVETDGEHYAIIHGDGRIEFHAPWADFEGKTLKEFADFVEQSVRAEIRNARCLDCGKDLRGAMGWDLDSDSPILRDDLWNRIVPGDHHGMLCREHMATRLGRALTKADLKPRRGE